MSWGEIFFGFHGRINRKTYWFASILVSIAGFLFTGVLAYLATGNPLAAEVWERPTGNSGLWVPIWLAYFLFLAWPLAAVAVKRLHDRERPAWIWYAYYAASIVFTLMPGRSIAGEEASPAAGAFLLPVMGFGLYVFFELSVLRGTAGPNQNGEDPLPPDYHGGDYSFGSWMLALEGRISREKWWLGMSIAFGVAIAAAIVLVLAVGLYVSVHPELEAKLADPAWIESKEAAPLLFRLVLWAILPSIAFLFSIWSFIALGVKRLHDRGLSSWLILVVVLPFFGALIADKFDPSAAVLANLLLLASAIWSVLQFGIFKGDIGPNPHGPDPLAGRG